MPADSKSVDKSPKETARESHKNGRITPNEQEEVQDTVVVASTTEEPTRRSRKRPAATRPAHDTPEQGGRLLPRKRQRTRDGGRTGSNRRAGHDRVDKPSTAEMIRRDSFDEEDILTLVARWPITLIDYSAFLYRTAPATRLPAVDMDVAEEPFTQQSFVGLKNCRVETLENLIAGKPDRAYMMDLLMVLREKCHTLRDVVKVIPGGTLRCNCSSRDTCKHRYKLGQLVIVVDQFVSDQRWLKFRAKPENHPAPEWDMSNPDSINILDSHTDHGDTSWTIRNMDSILANNLLYYEPREIVIEFKCPRSLQLEDQDNIEALAVLRAKLLDVMEILKKMRPWSSTGRDDQNQSLKIVFTGSHRYWIQRLPRIDDQPSPYYYEFLLIPLLTHWSWKDARVSFEDYAEFMLVSPDDLARLISIVDLNSAECERDLVNGRMYLPPNMSEDDIKTRKQNLDKSLTCMTDEEKLLQLQHIQLQTQHLQRIRESVKKWYSIFTNFLFRSSKSQQVTALAKHIVSSESLSDKDTFSSSYSKYPVGMMGYIYVEDGTDDRPELLCSKKLRDQFVAWALHRSEQDRPPTERSTSWRLKEEEMKRFFKKLEKNRKDFVKV